MMNFLAKFSCRHVESPTNPYNEAVGNLGLQTYLKMLLLDNFIRKLIFSLSALHFGLSEPFCFELRLETDNTVFRNRF